VKKTYDYQPFGEDILAGVGSRGSTFPAASYPTAADNLSLKFTSKERDNETGLDYFGARYFSGAQGRFTSPDPLMASARASNPQTWNRYTYALNSPLRYVDPDGLDVPASCAEDKRCQIVVKVNVIYDNTVNNGKGFTDQQKKDFEKNQLARAQKDFGNSNIKLDFSYTQGSYTEDPQGNVSVTGAKADSLNIVASITTPNPIVPGLSTQDPKTGTAYTFLNLNDLGGTNFGPFTSVTTEHELGHQFLGDPFRTDRSYGTNMFRDMGIDSRNSAQQAGVSQTGYRQGLEPRRYAAPLNPEANKPKQ
jgi:RHS repeat-associated protein